MNFKPLLSTWYELFIRCIASSPLIFWGKNRTNNIFFSLHEIKSRKWWKKNSKVSKLNKKGKASENVCNESNKHKGGSKTLWKKNHFPKVLKVKSSGTYFSVHKRNVKIFLQHHPSTLEMYTFLPYESIKK